MNPNYTEFKFPQIKAHAWSKIFSKRIPADAVDLARPAARPPRRCRAICQDTAQAVELIIVLPWGRRGRRALSARARALAGRAAAAVLAGAARDRAAGDDAPLLRRPARRGHAAAQWCAPGPHAARRAGPARGR